jgi:2-polyprenyl-3-methyl-5-hydroxy-6-metoxy-1,4-benzoquinol methylase
LRLRSRGNGGLESPLATYRTYRPDAAENVGASDPYLGFIVEFLTRPQHQYELHLAGEKVWTFPERTKVQAPHYETLLFEQAVLGRQNIYSSGPPEQTVAPTVLALARRLPGTVLDVGCGAGALVRALRLAGREAHGVEVERDEILRAIPDDVRPHVTLHSGGTKLPFADQSFDSVSMIEVLEHIPEPDAMVREVARVTRRRFLLTVPDISAIPRCASQQVVPWHLLEATHVNFFNAVSLRSLLERHFRVEELFWLHPVQVNGSTYFTSVAALAEPR